MAELEAERKESDSKQSMLEELEGLNRDLEVSNARAIAEKKTVEDKFFQLTTTLEEVKGNSEDVARQNQEMRAEIEVIIGQCKEARGQMKQQQEELRKRAADIEKLETALQQKDAELQKRESYLDRVLKQFEEKKTQLRNANLKVQEISRSVVGELKKKLAERDRDAKMLKEMIKGHYAEVQTKNREIGRLRKQVARLGKANEMRSQFIRTFADTGNEEQAKQLDNLRKLDSQPIKEEEEEEDKQDEQVEPAPGDNSTSDHGNANDDRQRDSGSPTSKEGDRSSSSVSRQMPSPLLRDTYKEKYVKRLDEYYSAISDASFHNNSSNVSHVLSQNYNAFAQERRRREEEPLRLADSLATPERKRSNMFDIKIDVNQIIQKSLGRRGVISTDKIVKSRSRVIQGNGASPLINRRLRKIVYT